LNIIWKKQTKYKKHAFKSIVSLACPLRFFICCTSADQMGLVIRLGASASFVDYVNVGIHPVGDFGVCKEMFCTINIYKGGSQRVVMVQPKLT